MTLSWQELSGDFIVNQQSFDGIADSGILTFGICRDLTPCRYLHLYRHKHGRCRGDPAQNICIVHDVSDKSVAAARNDQIDIGIQIQQGYIVASFHQSHPSIRHAGIAALR